MKHSGIKRVVAYARVSTNKKDQKNSFENQQTYFMRELNRTSDCKLIKRNIDGICVDGIYADKGISGTKLSRPAFDRMLIDAGLQPIIDADNDTKTTAYKINYKVKPKFDMIYVKDTSRFGRNVSINAILQTLKDNGVYVYFLDIDKTTENSDDMTIIQLFLSLAERESRDKSVKVSFGYEEGIRNGKLYVGGKIIGYDYNQETNSLLINKKEAEMVHKVFDWYTEDGLGHQTICNKLASEGYFNTKGKKFTRSTIGRMLTNEKYTGITNAGRYHRLDLFNRKQIIRDYNDPLRIEARNAQQKQHESQLSIINDPNIPKEQYKHYIEPIISVEQFKKAQQIREDNCKKYNNNCTYHGISDYARKIKCGCCGGYYIAQSKKYNKGAKTVVRYYACKHRFTYDEVNGTPKCNNPSIREDKLDKILNSKYYYELKLDMINEFLEMGELCKINAQRYINCDNDNLVSELKTKLEKLLKNKEKLLDLYFDDIYDKTTLDKKSNEIESEILQINNRIKDLSNGNEKLQRIITEIEQRLKNAQTEYKTISGYIKNQSYPTADRKTLLRDIECITVYDNAKVEIKFKSITALSEEIANMSNELINFTDLMIQEKEIDQELNSWESTLK